MKIVRTIAQVICAFLISIGVSAWIGIATLQWTVLDRVTSMRWLSQSGVYDNALNSLIQVNGEGALVDKDVLQKAFSATFPPSYIKQNTESVLNASYDWLEGKQSVIHFSIPVQDKSTEFSRNLAAAIQPKLAALPQCTARVASIDGNNVTCIPQGMTAASLADQLSQPSDGAILDKPITEKTLQGQGLPSQANWLPAGVQLAHALFAILPIVLALLIGVYILVGANKRVSALRIARQITINASLTLIGGILLWTLTPSVNVGAGTDTSNPQQMAIVNQLANPLARTILPDVGKALALASGSVVVVGAAGWTTMFILRRKRQHAAAAIPAPAQSEVQLPPPANPHS